MRVSYCGMYELMAWRPSISPITAVKIIDHSRLFSALHCSLQLFLLFSCASAGMISRSIRAQEAMIFSYQISNLKIMACKYINLKSFVTKLLSSHLSQRIALEDLGGCGLVVRLHEPARQHLRGN